MATRRRRVFRRGRRPTLRWTANQAHAQTLNANQFVSLQIVVPADYQQSANLEPSGVTFERLRGSLSMTSLAAAGVVHSVLAYIIVVDADVSVASGATAPMTNINLIHEAVMWHKVTLFDTDGLAPVDFDIDVKSKRRLHEHDVRLVIQTDAGGAISWSAVARALLRGG